MVTRSILQFLLMLGFLILSLLSIWTPIQRNRQAIYLLIYFGAMSQDDGHLESAALETVLDCAGISPFISDAQNNHAVYLSGMISLYCNDLFESIVHLSNAVEFCVNAERRKVCDLEQVMLGYAFAKTGRMDDAFTHWGNTPVSIYYLLNTAQTKLIRGEISSAEQWALWGVELDPVTSLITADFIPVNAYTLLGASLAQQEKWQEAFDAYLIGLATIDHPQPYITTADIALFRLNDLESAREVMEEAIEHWPGHMWVNLKLGDIYIRQQKIEQAERLFESAFERYPYNNSTNIYLGILRYRQGRFEESSDLMSYVLRENENQIVALVYFGLAQYHLGNQDVALQALQKASNLAPNDSLVINALATITGTRDAYP